MKKAFMLLLGSLLCGLLFSACTEAGQNTEYGSTETEEEVVDEDEETDYTAIPFTRSSSGLMVIRVSINGLGVDMAIDTGASVNTISTLEANYLAGKGLLTGDDVTGLEVSSLADGSIVPGLKIVIRELKLNDQIVLYNVPFIVLADDNASLLLGQEVLSQYRYEVDPIDNVIKFYDN